MENLEIQYEFLVLDGLNTKKITKNQRFAFRTQKINTRSVALNKALREKNSGNEIKQIVFQMERGEQKRSVEKYTTKVFYT